MKKPPLFLASLATLGLGGFFLILMVFALNFQSSNWLAIIFGAFGVALVVSGIGINWARTERQAQRENSRGNALTQSVHQLRTDTKRTENYDANETVDRIVSQVNNSLMKIERSVKDSNAPIMTQDTKPQPSTKAPTTAPGIAQAVQAQSENHSDRRSSIELEKVKTLNVESVLEHYSASIDSLLAPTSTIPLTSTPLTLRLPLENARKVAIETQLQAPRSTFESRAALLQARVLDSNDKEINFKVLPSTSEKYGYFAYLQSRGTETTNVTTVEVPRNAAIVEIAIRHWSGVFELSNRLTLTVERENKSWPAERPMSRVRVAAILDEFSYNSFKYDVDLVDLKYDSWKEQLDNLQPDLFLCESAWSGKDSVTRPWQGRVYASVNFNGENRGELLKILDYCKQNGIPTVFWNKEDPSHYDDKVHNFVDTALKFDHIFTTDLPSVNRYRLEHGHPSVNVLPFAVQPKLFNPIESLDRSEDFIFAGGWYSNHVERSNAMEKIFDTVLADGRQLKIYDRFYGSPDPTKLFPERFAQYLNQPIPNDQMANVYKESVFGITINTETKSPTMFARRIFELMACNTFVISNAANGVKEFFGDNVLYLDEDPEALNTITSEKIVEARAHNLKLVLAEHTYQKRLEKILDIANVNYNHEEPESAMCVLVNNPEDFKKAFDFLRSAQSWSGARTIIAGTNISDLAYADALTDFNRHGVRMVSAKMLLDGRCSLEEALGPAVDCTFLKADALPSETPHFSRVLETRLHSQYIDLPIEMPDEKSHNSNDRPMQYTITSKQDIAMALVPGSQLKNFLIDSLDERSTHLIYNV